MSDDLERIFLKVRSKYSLPRGVLPDPSGLVKVLNMSARSTPLETFKNSAELVLQVLKKSTNECLRNGFTQAMSCNDIQTALTCQKMLEIQNNSQSGSSSQTQYPSCSNVNSFCDASKNRMLLSKKKNQNQNCRPGTSVSQVRADSNLNIKDPLTAIVESEEENASNSNVSEQVNNQNNSQSGPISQTQYPSCSNVNNFGDAGKNLGSLSNEPAPNQNRGLDKSASLVKAVSNLNINNPLSVIGEREEENDRNSIISGQVDNRAKTAKLASCQTSAKQSGRGKKHKFSPPSNQTRNAVDISSEPEQELSPKRHLKSGPGTNGKNEKDTFVKLSEVNQKSESEDSEIIFKPPQRKKKTSQQNKINQKEDAPAISRNEQNVNSNSEAIIETSSQIKPARRNKTLKDSVPCLAKSQSKVTEKASKKDINKPAPKPKTQTKVQNNAGKSDVKSTTNRGKKGIKSKGEEEENLPSTSKVVSEPFKSNIQGSAKRGKSLNKKISMIFPLAKEKQKPSASRVNKATADKPSAAHTKTSRKKLVSTKYKLASEGKLMEKKNPENIKTIGKKTVAKKQKKSVETVGNDTKYKDDGKNTKNFTKAKPPIKIFLSTNGDILTDTDCVPINLDNKTIVKRIRGG